MGVYIASLFKEKFDSFDEKMKMDFAKSITNGVTFVFINVSKK